MLAVAVLPALAGITTEGSLADSIESGYQTAVRITAVCTAIGGLIAACLVGRTAKVQPTAHPDIGVACVHEQSERLEPTGARRSSG